jgi:hypothetical protein
MYVRPRLINACIIFGPLLVVDVGAIDEVGSDLRVDVSHFPEMGHIPSLDTSSSPLALAQLL